MDVIKFDADFQLIKKIAVRLIVRTGIEDWLDSDTANNLPKRVVGFDFNGRLVYAYPKTFSSLEEVIANYDKIIADIIEYEKKRKQEDE